MPMKPYGLLCPISHACELLQPRWTIQIITELWAGSTRFNDIRRGIGNISSALLAKRLRELEAAGLVERVENSASGTIDYFRTEKAVMLEPALNALAEWAQCNIEAELVLRHTDISTLMWKLRQQIVMPELPNRRVVIRFRFNETPPLSHPTYWLVVEPGASMPELCTYDPLMEVDLFVETNVMTFGAILMMRSNINREMDRGCFFLSGDAGLVRTIGRWLDLSYIAGLAGVARQFEPDPNPPLPKSSSDLSCEGSAERTERGMSV